MVIFQITQNQFKLRLFGKSRWMTLKKSHLSEMTITGFINNLK